MCAFNLYLGRCNIQKTNSSRGMRESSSQKIFVCKHESITRTHIKRFRSYMHAVQSWYPVTFMAINQVFLVSYVYKRPCFDGSRLSFWEGHSKMSSELYICTQVLMCNAYPHAHKYSQVHGKETHSTEQVVTPLTKVKILAFRRTYCQFEYYNWKLPEKKIVILFELLIYSYHYGLIKYILQT